MVELQQLVSVGIDSICSPGSPLKREASKKMKKFISGGAHGSHRSNGNNEIAMQREMADVPFPDRQGLIGFDIHCASGDKLPVTDDLRLNRDQTTIFRVS